MRGKPLLSSFDLGRFRDLAFGREGLPDHPMGDVNEARKLLALLPEDDPAHGLAELTHWTATMNATDSFTPGRRARVLMLMHEAARPLWRALGQLYLAPDGRPDVAGGGDPAILRAMFDSASEFANGFAITLDDTERRSRWVEENAGPLLIRNLRWLSRRLALSYMLQQAHAAAIWERLHNLHALAIERGALKSASPAFDGGRHNTSAQAEYARAVLLELANPSAIRPRDVELVYRIAARVANAVRFEPEASTEANFAVVPRGDARPGLAKLLGKPGPAAPVFINTVNCLPRLRAMLERDLGRDPAEEDTLFGRGYAIRERNAMLQRVIDHWGMDPPRRRAKRVSMASSVRVIAGFDRVLGVIPPADGSRTESSASARRELQLRLDDTSSTLRRDKVRAARVGPARMIDASAGGLGIAIRRADAPWAAHGALLAIAIEPGTDWFLGVLRRIYSVEDELRLGVQLLAAKPRSVVIRTDTVRSDNAWEEAMRFEANFSEHFQRGILLEPQSLPLAGGEVLLAPKLASRGTQFTVPLPSGSQRMRVTRLVDDGAHYQRAMFEVLAG